MNDRIITFLGWIATLMSILMYFSYIPQILHNVKGDKGDWLQPMVAASNCTLWVLYGLFMKPKKNWPLAISNMPGIFFGICTFLTAL